MRSDPFRQLDRLTDELFEGQRRAARSFPMDAYRRGDQVLVHFDLPGVQKETIELTVERNVLTVRRSGASSAGRATRLWRASAPKAPSSGPLFLADTLDADNVKAEYEDGVLSLTIPVAERAKPRRVEIRHAGAPETIAGSATGTEGEATPQATGTADLGEIETTAPGPRP